MLELSNSHKPFLTSISTFLGSFSILLFLLMLIPIASAQVRTISFNEQYQDYLGNWHIYNNENLANYPYYIVSEDANNYTITRMDDSIRNFSKNNVILNLNPSKISFTFNFTPSQLNSRSVKDGVNWYIPIPKPRLGNRFGWDDLKPDVYNETGIHLNDTEFWYQKNGEIRLYYNQTARNFGINSKNIYFVWNSYIVNNATTQGWTTSNISLNGSRFTDNGLLAMNLRNDPGVNLSGLLFYASEDETQGVIIHNVNTESGLINTTNQGTWNGNTTLNFTTGKIGEAGNFDGVNDYVNMGNDASLNVTNQLTIEAYIKTSTLQTNKYIVSKPKIEAGTNGWDFNTGSASNRLYFSTTGSTPCCFEIVANVYNGVYHHVVATYNGSVQAIYVDGSLRGSQAASGTIQTNSNPLYIGRFGTFGAYFNGAIDEVRVWNRALNASEIAIIRNTSMRTVSMPVVYNLTATAGYRWNRTRLTCSGTDNINNISMFSRQNTTTTTNLYKQNTTCGIWDDIPVEQRFNAMDFGLLMRGNGSNTSFVTSLELDEEPIPTLADIHGWVNNTLGAPVNGVRIDLDGNHTYSSKRRIVNNTNLAPTIEADMPGTGERLSGVTYRADYSDIELFAWAHANQSGQTAEIHLFINGVKVQDISGKPLGAAEENNKSMYAVIPKGANYSLEFLNEHHHVWVEYLMEDGYYDFNSVNTGNYTMTFQQVGYYNFTTTKNLQMNSVVNATMIPLTDESGYLAVLDGVDIAWFGFLIGLVAFVFILKTRKRYRKEDKHL